MVYIVLGVLGVTFGSFINALVWRLHEQEEVKEKLAGLEKKKKLNAKRIKTLHAKLEPLSILKGRSMCTHCGHQLAAKDLVPVLSWVSLRGKCRYCRKKIADTPLVEVATAGLFIASYIWWPLGFDGEGIFNFVAWLAVLVVFVALLVYDLRWMLLPNRLTYPLIVFSGAVALINIALFGGGLPGLLDLGISLLIACGLFWALFELSKGKWIGGGDAKLGAAIGAIIAVPMQAFLVIFVASLLGTFAVLPGLLSKKLKGTSHIPFGPFLIMATILVKLFGAGMVTWYRKKFLLY